jgi:ankyrin repeat protein
MAYEEGGAAAQLRLLDELLGTLRETPGAVAAALPPRRAARAAEKEAAESEAAVGRRRSRSVSGGVRSGSDSGGASTESASAEEESKDEEAGGKGSEARGAMARGALAVRQRWPGMLKPEESSPVPSLPASPASYALSVSPSRSPSSPTVSSPASVSHPGSPAASPLGTRGRRQGVLELAAADSSSPIGASVTAGSPTGIGGGLSQLRLEGLDARSGVSDPFEAIRSGSLLQLRMWLAARCAAHRSRYGRRRAVNLVDGKSGRALLHEACLHGREDCVRELLSYQGACDRNKPTLLGRCSPLHLAAGAGHNNVVRVLCKAGADIEARNKLGETPLHVAANAFVAKTLIFAGADPFSRNKSGASPSQTAAMNDRADVYDALQAEVVRLRKYLACNSPIELRVLRALRVLRVLVVDRAMFARLRLTDGLSVQSVKKGRRCASCRSAARSRRLRTRSATPRASWSWRSSGSKPTTTRGAPERQARSRTSTPPRLCRARPAVAHRLTDHH